MTWKLSAPKTIPTINPVLWISVPCKWQWKFCMDEKDYSHKSCYRAYTLPFQIYIPLASSYKQSEALFETACLAAEVVISCSNFHKLWNVTMHNTSRNCKRITNTSFAKQLHLSTQVQKQLLLQTPCCITVICPYDTNSIVCSEQLW